LTSQFFHGFKISRLTSSSSQLVSTHTGTEQSAVEAAGDRALSGLAARCTPDLVVRRRIDSVMLEVRREIATICSRIADEANEPPLSEQD
jgi:hypothetical protein